MAPFDPGMSTNLLASAAPAAPAASPGIFMGFKKAKDKFPTVGGMGGNVISNDSRVPVFRSPYEVMAMFDANSREDFLRWRNMMIAAGVVSPEADPATVRSALGSVLGDLEDMAAQGIRMSPIGYLKNLIRMNGLDPSKITSDADYATALGSAAAEDAFTGTKKQVSRSVSDITEGQAFSSLQGTLSAMLGRDPSDDEVRDFTYRMNALAAENPSISTTIARYKNGEMVGTKTKTDPGFTPDDMAMEAYEGAQADPEYAETQAGITYFNAAMSALGPMGGGSVG